ncbi:MAG: AAA family ATPase [Nostoc sp.]|uniref:AAA family ATPase n=1 Tax=Nostoc sp. TaxID=1180 RepID=UPI002FF6FC20
MIILPEVSIQTQIYESPTSQVYRGIRIRDDRRIIVKLLKLDYPSPQEIIRYRQEYQITCSLDLEGAIKAYSQKAYQRTLVILLEDFGGESIARWMQQPNFFPMSLSSFLKLAIDITDILGKIHGAGVIHKDINPGNIVLNPNTGLVKIIDFGIATYLNRTNPAFKSPHALEGTLAYLSPEQTGRMNRSLDYRTDFYSLGVTFYELLTGQLPFPTNDVLELVHCHIAKQPISPHDLNTTIPKPVSDIILKLMAKNAEDRYQSAWGIKADLQQCAEQLTTTSQITSIQLGLQDVSDQFQIPQKLYGRETEVAALLAAFDRVAVSNSLPMMMLVSGDAGIGKSALVQELYKPITQKRGYFISGKFDQFQHNIPYSALVDALRKLVQQLLGEPDKKIRQWRSHLLNAVGNNGQLIVDVIPEVELIIGKQPQLPDVGSTEAQNRFNLVFQKFIRACCSYEHPLVIFLDDLQWIDSATLKLIELILTDSGQETVRDPMTQSLLLIGAYRDNEVTPAHPLIATLEKLKQEAIAIRQIMLTPLGPEAVTQLIAETLHSHTEAIAPLAKLVWRKTNGNPYFTNEFLKILYAENLIVFNLEQRCWQWDIAQIKAKNITDNVVELTIKKLKQLPEPTQRVLRLAACVGAEFDLATLAAICEQPAGEIFAELTRAIQAELIIAISELDENLFIQNYKFSHDRVQQAAYALIPEEQQPIVHLQIGYLLLQSSEFETTSQTLFKVVDHLNIGRNLVTNQQERDRLTRLNLLAGQKAKKTSAHSAALQYLTTGIELLAADSWQTQYALTLALCEEATEAAYLSGDLQEMEQQSIVVLENANTVLDKIKVYETKIQTYIAQGQQIEGIKIGLEVLRSLGINLPEKPTEIDVQKQLKQTAENLSVISPEYLLELPLMREPDKLAAMQILSSLISATFQAAPLLLPLIIAEQINLSVCYGNTSFSSFAYAAYGGMILNGIIQDFEKAYQFGKLALNLTARLDSQELKCKVVEMVAAHILHCKEHIKQTVPLLQEGYEAGLETGDLEFSAYCAGFKCVYLYFTNLELNKIVSEIKKYSSVLAQIKQVNILNYLFCLQQFIYNLTEPVERPYYLVGSYYNEEQILPIHIQANDRTPLYYLYLYKFILSYLFEDIIQAREYAAQTESYIDGVIGTFSRPVFYFYDSLTQLQLYSSIAVDQKEYFLLEITKNQEKMRKWAQSAPTNCQHKYDLVAAEKARILNQFLQAEDLYEQAIQGAKNNEFLQEEALAYELAAKHYLARGREKFAQTYMQEARYCYERWGATAKVKDLETRYPQMFSQSANAASTSIHTSAGTISTTPNTAFDLATVMKASQAIASEIELEQLLCSLMQILIENAGAQTGFLLLEDAGEWAIAAAGEVLDGEQVCKTQVMRSRLTTNPLPESIIQYVIRTRQSIILNDASREGDYINDPYIQQHQTRSLLCLPLLNQSQLVGILYLENQLATGVFTPERSHILNLLSTQAAIGIENAKLYSKLRTSESQMAQFLEAIPVGIGIIDATGRPYYANQLGIQLLGKGIDPNVKPGQIAEVYQLYLAGTDQTYPTEKMPIIRALRGDRTRIDDMEIHQNNAIIPVEGWGTPVFDEQGKVAYAIAAFQHITERKQAEHLLANYNRTLEQQVAERTAALQKSEAALREREQELRLITDTLPALISYVDRNQRYQFLNQTYEVWFGCNRDEILGKTVREFICDEAYQIIAPNIARVQTGQLTTYEAEIPYPAGKRYITATFIPDFNSNAQVQGYYSLVTDISEQRNAALRESKRAEEASILEERNRMAREIHDTLAQAFTGILAQVGAANQVLTDDLEATQAHLDLIKELARTGLVEARRSVIALRPQLLEEGSLQSALHRLVAQIRAAANDTTLYYEIEGTVYSLPAEVENNLLRIGQEALTNAIKHANAEEIRVELVYDHDRFFLRVKDNGRGFGVGSIPSSDGFGLLGMSERAERIGAQLTIKSQPGQGTEIIVLVRV